MKDVFIILLAMFVSALIGVFGFSQLVGSIKYFHRKSQPVVTIAIWGIVLFVIWLIANSFLGKYMVGFYIGYGIAFLLSLSVKPDSKYDLSEQQRIQHMFFLYRYFYEISVREYDTYNNGLNAGVVSREETANHLFDLVGKIEETIKRTVSPELRFPNHPELNTYLKELYTCENLLIMIVMKKYDLVQAEIAEERGLEPPPKYFIYDDTSLDETMNQLQAEAPVLRANYERIKTICQEERIPIE